MKKVKIAGIPEKARNTGMPYYTTDNRLTVEANSLVNPSTEREITVTAKPVDEKDATIEAEVGEVIARPGLLGLHKIGGKKHSKGGTPLAPLPGSFIFSDDKGLAITKEEKEAFNFKETGTSKKDNTPAKLLKREIDIKKYNTFIDTLQDSKTDQIAQTTAALMLAKYQDKLGQIAFLQEIKKDEQPPIFSAGTAPVNNPELEIAEDEQLMYKKGGKYPDGGPYPGDKNAPRRGQQARGLTRGFNKFDAPWLADYGYTNDWSGINKALSDLGYASNYTSPYYPNNGYSPVNIGNIGKMQQFLVDRNFQQGNYSGFNNLMGNYGLTNQGVNKGLTPEGFDYTVDSTTPVDELYEQFVDNKFGVRSLGLLKNLLTRDPKITMPNPGTNAPLQPPTENTVAPPVTNAPDPQALTNESIPSLGYDVKGRLTPAQRANLAYLGYQAMNVKRYMPMRQQVELPQVNLDTVNAQPLVNAINNQAYFAQRGAGSNSRTAALNASNIYGKSIDALSQVYGNVNNQNIQIGNQENMTNLQQATNQVMTNTQLDAKYYDQTIASRENYDREKRFAQNQFASTMNKYQSDADQLAWALASVNKYGNRQVIDKKTGKIYNQPVPMYEYNPDGSIRYNADVANLANATGAQSVNSMAEIQKILGQFNINPTDPKQTIAFARLYEAITGRGRNTVYTNNPLIPQ